MKRKDILKHEIIVRPAFDKRNDNPSKDYGIGSCCIIFVVVGKEGAITVDFFTNWYLPSTIKEYSEIGINCRRFRCERDAFKTKIDLIKETEPISGGYWNYHSRKKKYSDQTFIDDCPYTKGKCYSDGSCLRAYEYLSLLFEKGSEGVFNKLEKDYFETFKSAED